MGGCKIQLHFHEVQPGKHLAAVTVNG